MTNELLAKNEELKQEIERLKELCDTYEEEHNNEFKIWKDERHQLSDYKSRIDKAIECVKKNMYYFPRPDELLNILNGGDKE